MIPAAGSVGPPGEPTSCRPRPRLPRAGAPSSTTFTRPGSSRLSSAPRRGPSLHTFREYLYGSQVEAHDHPPARVLPVTPFSDLPDGDQPDATPDALLLILDDSRRLAVAPVFDADMHAWSATWTLSPAYQVQP
jgi:hypothetical protein